MYVIKKRPPAQANGYKLDRARQNFQIPRQLRKQKNKKKSLSTKLGAKFFTVNFQTPP